MPPGVEISPVKQYQGMSWWLSKTASKDMDAAFEHIKGRDAGRDEDFRNFARIYANRDVAGYGPRTFSVLRSGERVTWNVSKACVDIVASRIAKSSVRPRFLTDGGAPSMRRNAKLLEKWVEMQFYLSGFTREMRSAFVDACSFGLGAVYLYAEGTKICAERLFPGDIFVDPVEGLTGKPRTIYLRRFIGRDVLEAMYPDKAALIRKAKAEPSGDLPEYGRDTLADQLEVRTAWHLPSKEGADDGKVIVAIRGGEELACAPWDLPCFPIILLRWSRPLRGFWGIGLIEELLGIQVEINRLLGKIQKAHHLMASPQWWLEGNSRVKTQQMTNEIGTVHRYHGQPPVILNPPVMNADVYSHLDRLYQKAFEIAGVGSDSAGMLPAGLETGAAVREVREYGTERFALVVTEWEQAHCDAAELLVSLGRKIAKENAGYSVVASRDKHTVAMVKWSEVDLDRDAYVLKVFPASSLPTHPAGRKAEVIDMLNAQLISVEEGKRLLDFPDIEAEESLDRAASDNIDRMIEKILDDGVWMPPEPLNDLQLLMKRAQAWYNRAKVDGVPEDRLRLLRQFMAAAQQLMQKATVAAQNAGPVPVPGAPPPVSPSGQSPMSVSAQDGPMMGPPGPR
jgi:hypothetical protein